MSGSPSPPAAAMEYSMTTTGVDERRKLTRQRVYYRMDVLDGSGTFFGCMLDVSASGMRVLCSEEIDVLNVTKLRIHLPKWLDLGEEIRVQGRFVWCKAQSRQKVEGGFSFDELHDRERSLLEHLVERLATAALDDGLENVK